MKNIMYEYYIFYSQKVFAYTENLKYKNNKNPLLVQSFENSSHLSINIYSIAN